MLQSMESQLYCAAVLLAWSPVTHTTDVVGAANSEQLVFRFH